MSAKKKIEPEDLGLLTLPTIRGEVKPIFAIAVPSTARGLIVRYDIDEDDQNYQWNEDNCSIVVTCSVPAQKMELLVSEGRAGYGKSASEAFKSYKKQKVKLPPILFSMGLSDIPTQDDVFGKVTSYFVFAHNTKKREKLYGCPFGISNVYEDGGVCFGQFNPGSLKEAYNTFWNSPFNTELIDDHLQDSDLDLDWDELDDMSGDKYMRLYMKKIFKEKDWEDLTDRLCGPKFWACPEGCDAVLITQQKSLLNQIPEKYWRVSEEIPIIISKVTKGENEWLCESGAFKFRLPLNNLTTTPTKRTQQIAKKLAAIGSS